MKCHNWTKQDESLLMDAVAECKPLFDHYKTQGKSYSDSNVWDAIAGRMLPDICVTGAACRRHFEIISKEPDVGRGWEAVIEQVNIYERELAETTFDGVTELMGSIDAIFDILGLLASDVKALKKMWS